MRIGSAPKSSQPMEQPRALPTAPPHPAPATVLKSYLPRLRGVTGGLIPAGGNAKQLVGQPPLSLAEGNGSVLAAAPSTTPPAEQHPSPTAAEQTQRADGKARLIAGPPRRPRDPSVRWAPPKSGQSPPTSAPPLPAPARWAQRVSM